MINKNSNSVPEKLVQNDSSKGLTESKKLPDSMQNNAEPMQSKSPATNLCKCGHEKKEHNGKTATDMSDGSKKHFCRKTNSYCEKFEPQSPPENSQGSQPQSDSGYRNPSAVDTFESMKQELEDEIKKDCYTCSKERLDQLEKCKKLHDKIMMKSSGRN